jgi:hypothetical protein
VIVAGYSECESQPKCRDYSNGRCHFSESGGLLAKNGEQMYKLVDVNKQAYNEMSGFDLCT